MEENLQPTGTVEAFVFYIEITFSSRRTHSDAPQPISKRSKDRKKKKLKSSIPASTSTIADDSHQTNIQSMKCVESSENVTGLLQ
jgi:hypothetical protein